MDASVWLMAVCAASHVHAAARLNSLPFPLLLDALQDDIERLLEYVAIGPRFSNAILQVCGP
jgi:hypothetical protein